MLSSLASGGTIPKEFNEGALNTTDVLCEDILQRTFRRGAGISRFALLNYETEVAQVEMMNQTNMRFWGVNVLIGRIAFPIPTTEYAALFPCGFVRHD